MKIDYDLIEESSWHIIEIHACKQTRQYSVTWGREICFPEGLLKNSEPLGEMARNIARDKLDDYYWQDQAVAAREGNPQ